ncbi:MAG TPA: 2OG-Fe(II) oxygenase [Rhizomicrobium sp.]|jgi:PKHD-type hydroxylase|nr:2OG-Fe(II) oxygenase [Rhizomicrobium sp.]
MLPYYDHSVGAFTDEELDRLERYCDGLSLDKGLFNASTPGQSNSAIRSTQTAAIQGKAEVMWFFERLASVARTFNDRSYRFDLRGFNEAPQFLVYRAAESGHYNWHMDVGRDAPRKLSMTIQLTDPSCYEGCELQFNIGTESISTPKGRGVAVAFPSYMIHRVTPITSGMRKAIVAWVTGPEFK